MVSHNAEEAHSCVDTGISLVKQLTNTLGSKCPALKYLSTVVYCSTSEIQASVVSHD